MTIKQLYDWAFQNDAQDFDIGIVNQDGLEIDWISTKDLFMNKQDMEVIVLRKQLKMAQT